MPSLTLRVIDSNSGNHAEGVEAEISRLDQGSWQLVGQTRTATDGSCHLLSDADGFEAGYYEVALFFGEYFLRAGYPLPGMKFVDIVPVRFGFDQVDRDHTVTVNVTPYGYSVLRS